MRIQRPELLLHRLQFVGQARQRTQLPAGAVVVRGKGLAGRQGHEPNAERLHVGRDGLLRAVKGPGPLAAGASRCRGKVSWRFLVKKTQFCGMGANGRLAGAVGRFFSRLLARRTGPAKRMSRPANVNKLQTLALGGCNWGVLYLYGARSHN